MFGTSFKNKLLVRVDLLKNPTTLVVGVCQNIDAAIIVDNDIFDVKKHKLDIAASTDYADLYNLPEGSVISQFKDQVSNKELNDFESFIESIESFLTDRHDLELVYKNKCDYNSFYYTLLAKDKNGKIIVRFELRLRISNHDVKRIKAQQHNRSEEDRIVREELEKRKIPAFALHKMNKIQLNFVVNNESYHSYGSAFNDIINEIDEYLDN